MTEAKKYHGQDDHEAHAMAMGKIVIAWNLYHETLGELFAKLFARNHYALALTAWQALNNDLAQRTMLAEVARVKYKPSDKVCQEVVWLVEITNQMISDQRNLGTHTPLMSFTDLDGKHQMLPLTLFGNKRAPSMHGLDLLAEFAHYEIQIRKMNSFAIGLSFVTTPKARRRGNVVWPQRPQLAKRATEKAK